MDVINAIILFSPERCPAFTVYNYHYKHVYHYTFSLRIGNLGNKKAGKAMHIGDMYSLACMHWLFPPLCTACNSYQSFPAPFTATSGFSPLSLPVVALGNFIH